MNEEIKNSQLSSFTGRYMFDNNNLTKDEIKNGSLVYKNNDGKGFVFKNKNGNWVVSIG